MRNLIAISSLLAMLIGGCVAEERDTTIASESAAAMDSRPNILLIIGDDMGFSDVSGFASEVRTPNIDALAIDSDSLGIIGVPADFYPVTIITGGQ